MNINTSPKPLPPPSLVRAPSAHGLRRSGSQTPAPISQFIVQPLNESRRKVLKGNFMDEDSTTWRSPQWKLLIFISSTFTDTGVERNILMSEILPQLRQAGQRVGIEVTFVDMRWGVRDENTLDHRTWLECSRELERCRRDSSGIFFLSLQSHKYGYVSLPRSIVKTAFDKHIHERNCSEHVLHLAEEWYRLDKNAVPEEYVLKHLESMNDSSYWQDALPNLVSALDGLNFGLQRMNSGGDELLVGRSVTEWETRAALACNAARGFWMWREFSGGVNRAKDSNHLFDDTLLSHEKKSKLKKLKDWMQQTLPAHRVMKYEIAFDSYLNNDEEWSKHVKKWKADVHSILMKSLQELTDHRRVWDQSSCGLDVPGAILNEMLHHSSWAASKCNSFHGREALVQSALIHLADQKLINALSKLDHMLRRRSKETMMTAVSTDGAVDEHAVLLKSPRGLKKTISPGSAAGARRTLSYQDVTAPATLTSKASEGLKGALKRQAGLAQIIVEEEEVSPKASDKHLLRTASYPIGSLRVGSVSNMSNSFFSMGENTIENSIDTLNDNMEVLSDDISMESGDEEDVVASPWIRIRAVLVHLCNAGSLLTKFRDLWASVPAPVHSARTTSSKTDPPHPPLISPRSPLRNLRMSFGAKRSGMSISSTISSSNESPGSPGNECLLRSVRSRPKFSEFHSTSRRLSGNEKVVVRDGYAGVSLAIVGMSGTGKTALMAMLAAELFKHQLQKDRIIIIRFCGTSPGSTNGRSLVLSICHQIVFSLDLPFNPQIQKMSYDEIVSYFHKLMHKHPVVLLIDSLDQLSDADLARSDISFLKGIRPHKNSRIVVSTLPDERNPVTGDWMYYYGCSSKLASAGVPKLDVTSFKNNFDSPLAIRLSQPSEPHSADIEDDALLVMRSMLNKRGRTLTDVQWQYVTEQASIEPTALYLWLAVRVVDTWSSHCIVGDNALLASGVRNLIMQIFDDVERSYGRELTRAAFGFITWSVSGVSDAEMEDLLSLDEEVMTSVNQYCQDATRLPSHVWLRLRGVVYGLVTEREGGCLSWYHRQLRETAERRYSAEDRLRLQTLMAKYYGGIVDDATAERTHISRMPLIHNASDEVNVWLHEALVNNRRCEEAVEHMIMAGMYSEAVKELCNIESVVARAKVGGGFTMITQLAQLLKVTSGESLVDHYYRWIRRDIHTILKDPTINITLTCARQPLSSLVRRDLSICMQRYDQPAFIDGQWTRCRRLGGEHEFDPLQSILQAHTDTVSCVCFSSDGGKIASASWDKTIRIWDASVGNILRTLEGHTQSVMSVAFNAAGTQLVSGSDDNTVRIWDASVGSIIHVLEGHTACINSVCVSSNDMLIASGSNDNTVKLWNILDGSMALSLKRHTNFVVSVAISYDSRFVASGSHDSTVRVWDCVSGDCLHCLSGHTDRVNSICWSYDNKMIVSGSDDETVRTWDVRSGKVKIVIEGQHDPIPSVCISSDGAMIISGSWDSTIRMWDPSNGSLFSSLDGHTGTVNSVAMFPNGETVVSGSEDKTVRIWDANVWYSDRTSIVGHSGYVTCICFSKDGRKVVSGSEDKSIKIWDVASCSVDRTLEGHTADITSVCISGSGTMIASASTDNTIRIWNSTTGAVACCINNRFDQATVCFSPDGQRVIGGSWGYAIRVWNLQGVVIMSLKGHIGDVNTICVNSNGSRLLSGSCDNKVIVWDLVTSRIIQTLEGHEMKVNSVCWCQDESLMASASEDMTVRVWTNDGDQLLVFTGHTDVVACVQFSLDGRMLVTGSWDYTVKVWDIEMGCELLTLNGHTNRVNSVNVSEDGKLIASASDDKSILIWDSSIGTLLAKG